MDIGIWIVIISVVIAILLFLLALVALIASNVTSKIDRKSAVNKTASVIKGSMLGPKTQATAMVLADTSRSSRSKRLFNWFESLSLASLAVLGLGSILFLLSAFFVGI